MEDDQLEKGETDETFKDLDQIQIFALAQHSQILIGSSKTCAPPTFILISHRSDSSIPWHFNMFL
jgi:hypothetical protein